MDCKLVLICRSQFVYNRRFFTSHAKLRSTTPRLVITATACGKPCVSTHMCRLMPETFLPASYPLEAAVSLFFTLWVYTINSVVRALRPNLYRAAAT